MVGAPAQGFRDPRLVDGSFGGYRKGALLLWKSVSEVAAGQSGKTSIVRDSKDSTMLLWSGERSADLTKSGAGGLDTGLETSDTWYALHAAGKDADTATGINTSVSSGKLIDSTADFQTAGVVAGDVVLNLTDKTHAKVTTIDSATQLTLDSDIFTDTAKDYVVGPEVIALLSLSKTSPTLPSGYKFFRFLDYVRNGAGGDILKFFNTTAGEFFWDEKANTVLVALSGGTATGFTTVDCSTLAPPNARSVDLMTGFSSDTTGRFAEIRRAGATAAIAPLFIKNAVVTTGKMTRQAEVQCDESQQVEYRVNNALASLDFSVVGYEVSDA